MMKSLTKHRLRKPDVGHAFAKFKIKTHSLKVLSLALFSLLPVLNVLGQSLTVSPEHPRPGETIKIIYRPFGGALGNEQQISCTAILFNRLLPEQINLKLDRKGDLFTGSLATSKESQFVAFKFFNGLVKDEKSVNYQYLFYGDQQPVVGARYAEASLLTDERDMRFYGLKIPDYSKAFELLKLEKRSNIEDKFQVPIIRAYYSCLLKINHPLAEREILDYLTSLSRKNKTEQFFILNFWLYRILNRQELSQQFLAQLKVDYPNSPMFFTERYSALESAKTGDEMEGLVKKLNNDYQTSKDGKIILADFETLLARKLSKAYGKDLNLNKFYFYLKRDTSYLFRATSANEVASFLSSRNILLPEAQKISLLSVNYLDSALNEHPLKENLQTIRSNKVKHTATYGHILYQNEKYKEALEVLENLKADGMEKDMEFQAYYALALAKNKQFAKALPILELAISNGDADQALTEVFKESYLALGGTSQSYEIKLAELFDIAAKSGRFKLKKTMINEPMPDFTLMDSNGKKVSLADFKGKTIVMDFWAMWCFPCKQAFPGMQKLVNKYAGEEVVFLFVNTVEKNRNGLTKLVGDYMKENKYSFNVLFDQPQKSNPTIFDLFSMLKLKSLPTKIVIDKQGKIRFKSIGYLGSDEAVVKELSEQIELVK
jgi:thiol-disulfide isomerase/thioredoxin